LQSESVAPMLLAGDVPHGADPHLQRLFRVLEYRARQQRGLQTAPLTQPQISAGLPGGRAGAAGAQEAVRPPQLRQVGAAGVFASKACLEIHEISRIVLHGGIHYI